MQHITLQKVPGERYDAHSFKTYALTRNGVNVGTVEQNHRQRWEVLNTNGGRISVHTTIKAAVRVAARAL